MGRRGRKPKVFKLNLKKESMQSVSGFALVFFSLLTLLSFFVQSLGWGSYLQTIINKLFGWGAFFVPILSFILGLALLRPAKQIFGGFRAFVGLTFFVLSILALLHLFFPPERAYYEAISLGQGGGLIGYFLQLVFRRILSPVGAGLFFVFSAAVSVLVVFNTSFDEALYFASNVFGRIHKFWRRFLWRGEKFDDEAGDVDTSGEKEEGARLSEDGESGREEIEVSRPYSEPAYSSSSDSSRSKPPLKKDIEWQFPSLDLLDDPAERQAERGDVEKNKRVIEQTLESFGVRAKIVEINLGPAVTQYALEASKGTKLSQITNLSSDLAMALASPTGTIRIEAPIPGKSLVGIEVPNIRPQIVTIKEVLSSAQMTSAQSKLTASLGLDVSGNVRIADIGRMPHVLIAGSTGSGKSVLLRAFLMSLLFRATPDELKLILADPKRVEFSEYNGIPHLLTPVIVDPEKTLPSLKWALSEMNNRYHILEAAGARDINDFNRMSGFQAMPYIVIVIDELADIMAIAPAEVEKAITRLAQMSRATGVHLVLATQRPSTDVITGLIKANIPCRIAFNVTSQVDSRVVLDMPGAEKLLGRGDMLYVPPDASKPIRIQGPFVSNEEMRRVIGFLKDLNVEPEYEEEVVSFDEKPLDGRDLGESEDELYNEAVGVVIEYDKASASLLQRRLKIGYARAARLLDEMEERGVVGPAEGSKPREVLRRTAAK